MSEQTAPSDNPTAIDTADNLTPSLVEAENNEAVIASANTDLIEATPATDDLTSWDFSQFSTLIDSGGPVIIILLILSLIAMTVFLIKCWQFAWLGLNRNKKIALALQLWHNRESGSALSTLSQTRNPIARVLETAISVKSRATTDDALAREEVMRIAKRELATARSHLRILEVIATLSPLLGLLGTVLGMIEAFQKLQGAGSSIDPALLSGGIWEALLTTAAGLIVAIPAVMALNWLEQRIDSFKLRMEDAMTQIFTTELSAPPLAPTPVNSTTKTRTSAQAQAQAPEKIDAALAT